jgi:hypothetical protein
MTTDDPFWRGEFHAIAFQAMVSEARKVGTWPDSEAVRRTAYKLFEDEKRKVDSLK